MDVRLLHRVCLIAVALVVVGLEHDRSIQQVVHHPDGEKEMDPALLHGDGRFVVTSGLHSKGFRRMTVAGLPLKGASV